MTGTMLVTLVYVGQGSSDLSVGAEQVPIASLDTEQYSTIREEN